MCVSFILFYAKLFEREIEREEKKERESESLIVFVYREFYVALSIFGYILKHSREFKFL